MSQVETFQFSISKNGSILVALMSGSLSMKSSADFQKLAELALADSQIKFIFLDCSDLPKISEDIFPALIQFQKLIRSRKQEVRISGLTPELKKNLTRQAIVRTNEICSNLKEGLDSISHLLNRKDSPSAPPQKKTA